MVAANLLLQRQRRQQRQHQRYKHERAGGRAVHENRSPSIGKPIANNNSISPWRRLRRRSRPFRPLPLTIIIIITTIVVARISSVAVSYRNNQGHSLSPLPLLLAPPPIIRRGPRPERRLHGRGHREGGAGGGLYTHAHACHFCTRPSWPPHLPLRIASRSLTKPHPLFSSAQMAPKIDPNEVKIIYLRAVGGEVGASSALAPKIGPLGLVSSARRRAAIVGR